ncbi:ATP-binding protein [Streptomyces sp. NPDC003660]
MSQSTTTRRNPDQVRQQRTPDRSSHTDLPTVSFAFEAAFLPHPRRVGEMRRAANGLMRLVGVADGVGDDILLAVSELVTNAIEYGKDQLVLRLRCSDGKLRVEVEDGNPTPATLREVTEDAESGRGLWLVANLAQDWGVSVDGRTTWCTIQVAGGQK